MQALRVRVPFCGLPCSDLYLEGAAGDARVTGGCASGRTALAAAAAGDREAVPAIAGRAATADEALDAAAAILARAQSPFVYGLSLSPNGSARAAARLARVLRGAVDVEGSETLDAEIEAMAALGLCAATFGEIRARADVVLLWRCDPRLEHPALLSPSASILLVPPADRDAEASGGHATTIPVPPGGDLDALLRLRAEVAGAGGGAGRAAPHALRAAGRALAAARYAAILWEPGALAGPEGLAIASALALLTRDLNLSGRAAARPLGAGGNVTGAMAALLAAGGAPRALGFHDGAPRSASVEFSGAAMIEAGGADALVLVGARRLPAPARRTPCVVVGHAPPPAEPDVFLPAAAPGLDGTGLFLRADGLPVPIRPLLPSPRPQEEAILDALCARVAGEAA